MTLGELIEFLESMPQGKIVDGFNKPHSYRGYYDELAFEPIAQTTIGDMLACAKEALGKTYQGYKGGDFTMHEYTNVHLAEYGSCGEPITSANLKLWSM